LDNNLNAKIFNYAQDMKQEIFAADSNDKFFSNKFNFPSRFS